MALRISFCRIRERRPGTGSFNSKAKSRKIKALDLESAKRKKKSGFKSSNVETVVVTAFHRKDFQGHMRARCTSISPHLSGEIAGVVGVRLLIAIGSGTFLHALRVIIISAITATPCGLSGTVSEDTQEMWS